MQRVTFERLVVVCPVCRVCSSHRPVLDWSLCTPPPPARTSHHAAGSRLGHTATPAFKSARALAHIDSSWEHSMYVLSNEEMIKTKEPPKMFAPCAVLSRVSGPGSSDRRMTGEGQCTWTWPPPACTGYKLPSLDSGHSEPSPGRGEGGRGGGANYRQVKQAPAAVARYHYPPCLLPPPAPHTGK